MTPVSSLPAASPTDFPTPAPGRAASDPNGQKTSSFDDLLGKPSTSGEDKDATSKTDEKDPAKPALSSLMAGWPWMLPTAPPPPSEPVADPSLQATDENGGNGAENPGGSVESSGNQPFMSSASLFGGGAGTLKRVLMTDVPPGGSAALADGAASSKPMLGLPGGNVPSDFTRTVTAEDAWTATTDFSADLAAANPGEPSSVSGKQLAAGQGFVKDIIPIRGLPTDVPPSDAPPAPVNEGDNLVLPQPDLGGPGWKPGAPTPENKPTAVQPTTTPISLAPGASAASPEASTAAPSANPATGGAALSAANIAPGARAGVAAAAGQENIASPVAPRPAGTAASLIRGVRQALHPKGDKDENPGAGMAAAKTTGNMYSSQNTGQAMGRAIGADASFGAPGDEASGDAAKGHEPIPGIVSHFGGETLAPAHGAAPGDAALPEGNPVSTRAAEAATLLQRTMEAGERMRADGRGHVELQVPVNERESVTIQLRWENGALHTTFRTDSPELRQALERDWGQFTARCSQERGLPLASDLRFESNARPGSSFEGQPGFSQQQSSSQQQNDGDSPAASFTTDYYRVAANPRASLAAAAAAAPAPTRTDRWKAWA